MLISHSSLVYRKFVFFTRRCSILNHILFFFLVPDEHKIKVLPAENIPQSFKLSGTHMFVVGFLLIYILFLIYLLKRKRLFE